ncbi:MAG TPA: FIST N-terminal domain-containing protein [Chloroflexota bacterium]|nr:FIST N-terminal domain-containing protein [Chloroflexota bacterium]
MQAKAAISYARDWRAALDEVLAATDLGDSPCDLALFFASAHYSAHYDELVPAAWRESGARALAGCSGQGVIGPEREIEGEPAMSLLRLAMPGATVRLTHVTHQQVEAGAVARLGGVSLEDVNAWLVLADPFRMDPDALIRALEQAYPGVTIVGGLASSRPSDRRTYVFADDTVYDEGAVAVALGGNVIVRTVVSQGATPIGQPWTITGAHDNVLETIGGRPAYQVLVETVQALPADVQQRAVQNLLVGLAIDEYKDEFHRGDYLIRNLMGADPQSGALAIGAYPRVGQTIQFQMRDAAAADEDLRELLASAHHDLEGARPVAAMLCSCNGRGAGLFGAPDHDARGLAHEFGPVPLAGFFCNGEIGPIGGRTFLHGFTASVALLLPRE